MIFTGCVPSNYSSSTAVIVKVADDSLAGISTSSGTFASPQDSAVAGATPTSGGSKGLWIGLGAVGEPQRADPLAESEQRVVDAVPHRVADACHDDRARSHAQHAEYGSDQRGIDQVDRYLVCGNIKTRLERDGGDVPQGERHGGRRPSVLRRPLHETHGK